MKRHLLFALATLFATAGFAQKDVTAQYITNAKLDQGTVEIINNTTTKTLTGWTVNNFNNSQQGNNTQGWASECYAGWGSLEKSEYSLTQTITLPAGHYNLVNYSFFRQGLDYNTDASKSLAYLKAGDTQVAVKTLGSITAEGYANSQAEGANAFDSKMYRNVVDFTIEADGTSIEIGLYGTFDLKQSWMICGMFELIDMDQEATMDSPYDVTGLLTNPGGEYRNTNGWTTDYTEPRSNGYTFQTQSNNSFGNKAGGFYIEAWQASGALSDRRMYQTVTDIPNGFYQLSAYVNYGGTGAYIKANDNQKAVEAGNSTKYTVGTIVNDNTLTVEAGVAGGTTNYLCFDRFELKYCGDINAALQAQLDKLAEYQDKIPSAAYAALAEQVGAIQSASASYTEVDEYLGAMENLTDLYQGADALVAPYAAWQEAVADTELPIGIVAPITSEVNAATTATAIEEATAKLKAIEEPYSDWKEMLGYAEALVDVPNDNEDANNTLGQAINTQYEAVENATTAEEYANAAAALKTAMVTYAGVANPTSEAEPFDLTFMLTNPDLTEFAAWTKNVEGWYTDQNIEGQNSQAMHSEGVTGPHGDAFYEYWSEEAAANNQFTLYQKVTLPVGTYLIQCDALATANGVAGATTSAVYFYANDTQGSLVSADLLTPANIEFVNAEEQEVKIGLKANTGNQFRWMGIGYVQLFKVPAKAYEIDETAAWDNTTAGAGDVELKRTIKVGMNTVVLPFQLTSEDLVTLGGEGAVAYTVSAYDAATDNLTFATVTEVPANTPFFLNATQAGTEFSFEGKTVVAGEPESVTSDGACSLIGNYAASVIVPESDDMQTSYILSGGKFYKVDSAVTLKNTRFYLLVDGGSGANTLGFSIADETTGINGIVETENAQKGIYNLQGQKVEKAVKGIYIIDGKKVLVK